MKSLKGLPAIQDFFETYAFLIRAIRKSGYAAQVVSGLTEIGGIFAAAYTSLLPVFPEYALYAAGAIAVIGTAVIEVGLRVLLPHTVDAVLYKRFSGLYLPMTIAIWLCTALLLATSGVLSFQNSKEIVKEYMPDAEQLATDQQDSTWNAERASLSALFSQDSAMIAGRYESLIAAEKAAYSGRIQAKRTELSNLRRKESRTGQSYASAKDETRAAIAALEAEGAGKVASLEATRAQELSEARRAYLDGIGAKEKRYLAAVDSVGAINRAAIDERAGKVASYGGGLGYFTIICLFILCAAVTLDRIHRKGSGITETVELSQYDVSPHWWTNLRHAVSERFNYAMQSRITAFADKTPPAPLPTQPTQLYDPTQVSNITIVLKVDPEGDNAEILMQPKRRQIGFNAPSVNNASGQNGNASPPPNATVITQADKNRKNCLHCGQEYRAKVSWQKYCSTQCKDAYHASQHGGQSFNPGAYHSTKKGKP
ncbi:MAG: hypothetical protein J5I94_03840 [Phaeodactylibacter sp.]|nr:hypothetical protein [Phaeodactylibacter sp.]